jgi:hypothetical protein
LALHQAPAAEEDKGHVQGNVDCGSERFTADWVFNRPSTHGYGEGLPLQSRQTTTASSLSS